MFNKKMYTYLSSNTSLQQLVCLCFYLDAVHEPHEKKLLPIQVWITIEHDMDLT